MFLAPLAGALGGVASTIGAVVGIAGTVVSVGAGMAQAKYQQQVARYQQKVSENQAAYARQSAYNQAQIAQLNVNTANRNKRTAEENASKAAIAGRTAAQEQDQQTRALLGQQLGIQAASGLSLNSGSFLRTRKTARILGRQDAMRAQEAGDNEARNYRNQAYDFAVQANSADMQRINILNGGTMDANNAITSGIMAKAQGDMDANASRIGAISSGISGLGNFMSLIGSARPTGASFGAYVPNPIPKARSIYS